MSVVSSNACTLVATPSALVATPAALATPSALVAMPAAFVAISAVLWRYLPRLFALIHVSRNSVTTSSPCAPSGSPMRADMMPSQGCISIKTSIRSWASCAVTTACAVSRSVCAAVASAHWPTHLLRPRRRPEHHKICICGI